VLIMHKVKNMEKQNQGIVLSRKNNVVSMIDVTHGRFLATTFRTLMVGGVYSYDLMPFGTIYTLSHEELVLMPFEIARHDILFLHHMLEICLLFAPLGSCAQGVFQLLLSVYSESSLWSSHKRKKFMVFKLLASLGIWPNRTMPNTRFLQIAEIPVDRINAEVLELISEKEIEHWICQSMGQDPVFARMKTKIFLERTHHDD